MTSSSRVRPRPWWVAIVSGMASYIDAAAITGFATAIVIFQATLGLDEAQVGAAGGALTASIAVGALVGGRLGDRYGRRPIFTITMIAVILSAVLLIIAPSFPALLAGAILLGLSTGADLPVSLSTISEAATDENRGRLIGFTNLLWMAGIIANIVLSASVGALGTLGAQIIFAHIGIMSAAVLIGRLTIPESERWQQARADRAAGRPVAPHSRARVRDLLRAPYGPVFLALAVFASLTGLIANTVGQYGTYVLVNFGGASIAEASLISLPLLPLSIIGYLWFMKIADKPVRFRYFQAGGIAFVISPLVVAVFGVSLTSWVVSLLFMAVGSAFAFEGIQRVWVQEQFPTLLRTTAQGGVIAIQRFTAAGLAAVTPLILAIGPSVLFVILGLAAAIGVGWAWIVFRKLDQRDVFSAEDAQSNRIPASATSITN